MRIMILFPNTGSDGVIPLAVGILSSIAKDAGCEVRYVETTFYNKSNTATEDHESTGEFMPVKGREKSEYPPLQSFYTDFKDELNSFHPDVLAVHANSLEWELFKDVMENVQLPEVSPLVVVGGVHATIDPDSVMAEPFVNAVCVGEGEDTWAELIRAICDGNDVSGIAGLWVRTPKGINRNPRRPLIPADRLWDICPDHSLFDNRHLLKPYDGRMRRRALIEYSRGCPFSCSYCVNAALKNSFRGLGQFFRVRPFENFQRGVKQFKDRGAEILQLQDECFFHNNTGDIERFCGWYGKEIRLPLILQTRPESITEDKMRLVSGMRVPVQISLGVESGSSRILRNICGRHMTVDSIYNAFALIHRYGLRSSAYCMIGFPTETRREAFQTIGLIREIRPTVAIMSVFYPFTGVPLRKFCMDHGYIKGDEAARTFTGKTVLRGQPMSPEEVEGIRRCFRLYTKLPEKYLSKVERCERDFENNRSLFADLVQRSWSDEALEYSDGVKI
ncbi:MAG: radical SAM protein [Candidatus Omnitrophota bacterium]|nr:radical SAM protein [Candidatus Omnitrophota bacterium]